MFALLAQLALLLTALAVAITPSIQLGAPVVDQTEIQGEEPNFAILDANDVVQRVIVADYEFIQSHPELGPASKIKRTSPKGTIRKNPAGIGYTYDKTRDAFIPPKPVGATVFNEDKARWEEPTVTSSFVNSTSTPQ